MQYLKIPLLVFATLFSGVIQAGYTLIAHEVKSHIRLVLFNTESPRSILAQVKINTGTEFRNLGLSGSLGDIESSTTFLSNAVITLAKEVPDKYSGWHRDLDGVGVYIFNYSSYATKKACQTQTGYEYIKRGWNLWSSEVTVCLQDKQGSQQPVQTGEQIFWNLLETKLNQKGIELNALTSRLGNSLDLMLEASRVDPDKDAAPLQNTDLLILGDAAVGYQIRNGKYNGKRFFPNRGDNGGYEQVGTDAQAKFLQSSGPFPLFDSGTCFADPVLESLSLLDVSQDYAARYNDTILNRWREGFSAELGHAILYILTHEAPPAGIDIDGWRLARSALTDFMESTCQSYWREDVLEVVTGLIRFLAEVSRAELPEDAPFIRVMGDFPWYRMGFVSVIKHKLDAGAHTDADKERVQEVKKKLKFVSKVEYPKRIAVAGKRLLYLQ